MKMEGFKLMGYELTVIDSPIIREEEEEKVGAGREAFTWLTMSDDCNQYEDVDIPGLTHDIRKTHIKYFMCLWWGKIIN